MKTLTKSIPLLAVILSLGFVGSVSANPTIRERGGFEQDEQSPASSDVSMSNHVSHVISSSPALSGVNGDVSVTTVSEHTVILRGTVSNSDARDKIDSVLQGQMGSYQVQDDLVKANTSGQ